MSDKIRLAGIAENSLVNGPGLRKVFFSQGCTHHCKNCFNPSTWSFEGGKLIEIDDLVAQVKKEYFLDGVTFSGGDPFEQADKFAILAKKLKNNKINIWCYTGYTWQQLLERAKTDKDTKNLLELCDVVVDGPFVEELHQENLLFRGSSNQQIIDVKSSLELNKIVLFHAEK